MNSRQRRKARREAEREVKQGLLYGSGLTMAEAEALPEDDRLWWRGEDGVLHYWMDDFEGNIGTVSLGDWLIDQEESREILRRERSRRLHIGRTRQCPTCLGRGIVLAETGHPVVGSNDFWDRTKRCEDCVPFGTMSGRIPKGLRTAAELERIAAKRLLRASQLAAVQVLRDQEVFVPATEDPDASDITGLLSSIAINSGAAAAAIQRFGTAAAALGAVMGKAGRRALVGGSQGGSA